MCAHGRRPIPLPVVRSREPRRLEAAAAADQERFWDEYVTRLIDQQEGPADAPGPSPTGGPSTTALAPVQAIAPRGHTR